MFDVWVVTSQYFVCWRVERNGVQQYVLQGLIEYIKQYIFSFGTLNKVRVMAEVVSHNILVQEIYKENNYRKTIQKQNKNKTIVNLFIYLLGSEPIN